MAVWEKIAHDVENDYDGFVDYKRKFFICPFCGAHIHDDDKEYVLLCDEHLSAFECALCGETITEWA